MKKRFPKWLLSALTLVISLLVFSGLVFAAEEIEDDAPGLVEAKIVTEVLDWGETVTAIRLEYSEEIRSNAIVQNNEYPGTLTYLVMGDYEIDCVYVNNTGVKDDVEPSGKYVFLNFCVGSHDWIDYRDYVTFNTTEKSRPQCEAIYFYQNEEIETVSGKTIAPSGRTRTSGEIRMGIDEFTSVQYESELLEDDVVFYYHIYIPEGYEERSDELADLPLVVHFPSGDVNYDDYSGLYYGALLSHNDATEWVMPEAQSENPAFVLTFGCSERLSDYGEIYVEIIDSLIETYNIDTSRIYAIGLAGGGATMWDTILNHPDLFAGSISTSYEFYEVYGAEEAVSKCAELLDILPCWFFVGEDDYSGQSYDNPDDTRVKSQRLIDTGRELIEEGYQIDIAYGEDGEDMWNGLLRGEKAEAQAEEQLSRAEENGSTNLITVFTANTIRQTGHWSWTAVYTNPVVRSWLFQQVNETPYRPAA